MGTIDGDVLTGTWVDLPGGQIETGTGTLKIRIESNDRLTKISDDPAYAASVWTRTRKPGDSGTGRTGGTEGTGGTGGAGGTGAIAVTGGTGTAASLEPWQTPQGRALIDRWAAETATRVNGYNGSQAFNSRKPYAFNKYGIFEDKNLHSAFAPDDFKDHGNDREHYMWDIWIPGPGSGWDRKEWNELGIPAARGLRAQGTSRGSSERRIKRLCACPIRGVNA